VSFWQDHWAIYLLGGLLFPRTSIIWFFSTVVTRGFEVSHLFLPLTIWWKNSALGLGLFGKLGFTVSYVGFPRFLLAVMGFYAYPEDPLSMIGLAILGFFADIAVKALSSLGDGN